MAESGRNPPIQEATTPKTGWVLSGGGSLGAVQVGMLAELIAEGVVTVASRGQDVLSLVGYIRSTPVACSQRRGDFWRDLRVPRPLHA